MSLLFSVTFSCVCFTESRQEALGHLPLEVLSNAYLCIYVSLRGARKSRPLFETISKAVPSEDFAALKNKEAILAKFQRFPATLLSKVLDRLWKVHITHGLSASHSLRLYMCTQGVLISPTWVEYHKLRWPISFGSTNYFRASNKERRWRACSFSHSCEKAWMIDYNSCIRNSQSGNTSVHAQYRRADLRCKSCTAAAGSTSSLPLKRPKTLIDYFVYWPISSWYVFLMFNCCLSSSNLCSLYQSYLPNDCTFLLWMP